MDNTETEEGDVVTVTAEELMDFMNSEELEVGERRRIWGFSRAIEGVSNLGGRPIEEAFAEAIHAAEMLVRYLEHGELPDKSVKKSKPLLRAVSE